MVARSLSRRQSDVRAFLPSLFALAALLPLLLLAACRSSAEGTYRGAVSDRIVELRSGTAYITHGSSSQAVPYEVSGDKIVLKMPFMNTVLRRLPDGALSGMGEKLIKIDDSLAALLGTYESVEGEYRLQLGAQGRATYTRLGRSFTASYTVAGDRITLNRDGSLIAIKRLADGSLETPDAVLKKQS